MINQYLAVNRSFGSPFVYCLTQRGFYSEINNLLNAVAFGLAHKRRLIVNDSQFNDLAWQQLFATTLPAASIGTIQKTQPAWYISGESAANFYTIQLWANHLHKLRTPLFFPQLEMSGSLFQIKRQLAQMLTRPLLPETFPAGLTEPFAAIHIRRGDKTEGYRGTNNRVFIEGDTISPGTYIDKLMLHAPDIKSIFVMTDDYRMIDEIRQAGRDHLIYTFCSPEETGYRQREFSSLNPARKTDEIQRLIAEVQIAAASAIFLGGFKSNLARFVPLWHAHPKRCHSVDGQKSWSPD